MNEWEARWQAGRTGWDAGASPPVLQRLVDELRLPSGRTLVPGCGSGYDVLTLASAGNDVTGLEISPTAIERFERLRHAASIPASRARVLQTDFFGFRPLEPFQLAWDYTFLCALDPTRRADWARRMHELLAPGAELVTLLFPVDPSADPSVGPPFPLDPLAVTELLRDRFERLELSPVAGSHPARQGREVLARWRRLG